MTAEPLLVDTDTDRFAVLRDGAWVEFEIGDLISESVRQVMYGPIPHDAALCASERGCICWCRACETHNARNPYEGWVPPPAESNPIEVRRAV